MEHDKFKVREDKEGFSFIEYIYMVLAPCNKGS